MIEPVHGPDLDTPCRIVALEIERDDRTSGAERPNLAIETGEVFWPLAADAGDCFASLDAGAFGRAARRHPADQDISVHLLRCHAEPGPPRPGRAAMGYEVAEDRR